MFLKRQTQANSIYTRITRSVFVIVTVTFVLLGLVVMIAARGSTINELSREQRILLDRVAFELDTQMQAPVDDLEQLTRGRTAQRLAGTTANATGSGEFSDAQQQMLGEFIALLQQHPGRFLEIRYVDANGTVAARVSGLGQVEPDRVTYPGLFVTDSTFRTSMNRPPGTVTIGALTFLEDTSSERIVPLRAVFRYSAAVATTANPTVAAGVIQIDVAADSILNRVNQPDFAEESAEPGRHFILADSLGNTLADSSAPIETYAARATVGIIARFPDYRPDLNDLLNQAVGDYTFETVGEDVFSSATVEIPGALASPWRLLLVDSTSETLLPITLGTVAVAVGFGLVGLVISGVTVLVLRYLLRPLDTATALAQQVTDGSAPAAPPSISAGDYGDEIGQLITAFQQLSSEVDQLRTERDDQTQRYTRNIEIAARISRETATLNDVDQLLNQAIDLIVKEYGYYHAQVFLVDDIGLNALLAYSHGEIGRKLLTEAHALRIGSQSVIGQVTANQQPVIVNDTQMPGTIHRYNPLLPETRAEMAIPLQIGTEVIGALDIQSSIPNVFNDEVLNTFRLLADQVAIAIYKARLLSESETRFSQINRLNRQLTTTVWEDAIQQMGLSGVYNYDLRTISHEQTAAETEPDIAAEINVRGQPIGVLAASAPEGLEFSQNDRAVLRAVADRIALAIENARLFQETQASLAQTSVLYQISRYLNEADTLEDIVQAIIVSVMPDAVSGQVCVFDEYNPKEAPQWLEIVADWSKTEREDAEVGLPGVQLRLADYPILQTMTPDQVMLIQDIDHDSRLDDVLRAVLQGIAAQAAVFIPFSVRGVWRGIIFVEFPEPREFGDQEGRIYSTLIDQAGVAIENRLLLRQTELTLSQIERLYAASRIINTAQTPQDLIRAALATTADVQLNFQLTLLEGALDETGWPTRLHLVAQSMNGAAVAVDERIDAVIATDSPMRYREPQTLVDRNPEDEQASSLIHFIRQYGYRFAAVFPLFSANQPFSLFFITSADVRELSPDDYEIYRALTGQMSTVLQNRQLLEQTEAALDETRRLYNASIAIATAGDVGAVYREVAKVLAEPFDFVSHLSILLAVPMSSPDAPFVDYAFVWKAADATSTVEAGQRLTRQDAPLGRMVRQFGSGNAISFHNLDGDLLRREPARGVLARNGAKSVALTPALSGRKWLGYIVVESRQTGAFDEQYNRFLQAVAGQMAVALDNFNLFEEAQLQAQRALALAEAGQFANRISGSFETSLAEVFNRVSEPANYDRYLLMVLSADRQRLQTLIGRMPEGEARFDFAVAEAPHSVVDAVVYERTILVNEPHLYPAFEGMSVEETRRVGKHLSTPIRIGEDVVGAVLVGRPLDEPDLDENDEQLVRTLAAQVAVALENQRLFREAEAERQTLRSILDTMPAGVLVLDAASYRPIQFNSQAEQLLGRSIASDRPFNLVDYNIYRTGTNVHYPLREMPIFAVTDTPLQVDDVAVLVPNGMQNDLLVNAAPIFDRAGGVQAIVAAFTDISNLRGLENTLQENLRDTIALYEATRQLAEADEAEDVLDIITVQLSSLTPSEGYVLLLDERGGSLQLARSVSGTADSFPLPDFVLNPRQMFKVNDVTRDRNLTDTQRQQLELNGVRSMVSIPLRARSRRDVPLGWLVATFNRPNTLTPEGERFLTTLNDSAAVALDNRYLLKSTAFALQETAALYDATTSISRSFDLVELGRALQSALETLSPDVFAAYLYADTRDGMNAEEIFCVSTDGKAVALQQVISRYAGQMDANIYAEDLYAGSASGDLDTDLNALGKIKAYALVNLVVKGATKGCLFIGYAMPHTFSEGESRYLSTIADSASVIIDNILLFDQIQSTLEETSILYQASRALSDAITPQDIIEAAVNHLIDDDVSLIFMAQLRGSLEWESPDAYIEVVALWQATGELDAALRGVKFNAEQFPAWRPLSTTDILMFDSLDDDARLDPVERLTLESLAIKSAVLIPLRSGRRSSGVILIGSRQRRHHTDRDLRVYQSFSEQASLKMEASRLLAQTERRARQLATSAEVSRIASTILDLEALMPQIVNVVRDAFNYDHAQIFLMDDGDEFAELRASTGEAGRQLLQIKHKLQKGSLSVIGQVTARGEPVVALDTAEANVVHKPNPYLPNTRSEMAVPLIIKDRVVGALDVQSNQPNAFDSDDVAVLTTLAGQIAVSLDNARLFQQAESRANEMTFLFTTTTAAASASRLDDALANVAQELVESLEAESVSIYLPYQYVNEQTDELVTYLKPIALSGVAQPLSELSEVRLDDRDNLLALIAASRQPRILNNLTQEPLYVPVDEMARSAVVVPLVSSAQLIGVIAVESGRYNTFDNDTLTLLLTLSGTLSAIVQNQQLLERVQQTNEQLRELDRLKSDFLANMSHELRTPLNSIIGFSRVILKGIDGPLTEMQEQDLTTIYNSGQHLLNLINDILDQAKITANKMDLQTDYFDVKHVIDGVRSIGIGLVKDKPIDIRVELESGLPPAYGDEFRTRQVLLNLVSNAAKFTREGVITISAAKMKHPTTHAPMVKISVTDTGIGIAEKDIPLLFEAFRQVDSSLTRTVGGTGLGLPIAKSLIEMQGGDILVQSQIGVGSTFAITIPTEPVALTEEEKPKKKPSTGSLVTGPLNPAAVEGHNGKHDDTADVKLDTAIPAKRGTSTQETMPPMLIKRQILIIEENPDMVDQIRRALQGEGFDIFAASIPLEAEAMATGLHPTILIMDVNFAKGAGWDILQKLKGRDDTRDIPVIVNTISSDEAAIRAAGAFAYIQRPFMPETLVQAVRAAEKESRIERILIIDDQPEHVRLMTDLLNESGEFRIFSAQTGAEGVALVARRRPNLILLDLRLPEMDGFAVAAELRSNPETATIPILVVTGDTLSNEERERLMELEVMYKADISTEAYRRFIDGVKAHLARVNGD
jgi:GAF domain-containing protein/DNA-binding response OmpR family regulator